MNTASDSQSITLPDGRSLSYAVYGDLNGFPVFGFHGTPGSRLWFEENDPVAQELGIRLITPDRPGFGGSSAQPARKLTDYPKDIAVLARHLNLEKFAVLGVSGGSIFAAACAVALTGKITQAILISGVSEFKNGKSPKGMCFPSRSSFYLSRKVPWLMKFFLKQGRKMMFSKPEKYMSYLQKNTAHLCKADQEILQDPGNAQYLLFHLREANKQGVDPNVSEVRLVTRPWGFAPEDIKVPTVIWHGTDDTLAPVSPMREMSRKIPDCKFREVPQKGHFLMACPEVWKQILVSVDKAAREKPRSV